MDKLASKRIPIYYTVQRAGDVIVTSGSHQGFSLGLNFAKAVNFALHREDLISCLMASTCTTQTCKLMTEEEKKRQSPAMAMPWKIPIPSIIVPPSRCSNPLQGKRECMGFWDSIKSLRNHYNDLHRDEELGIPEEVRYLKNILLVLLILPSPRNVHMTSVKKDPKI